MGPICPKCKSTVTDRITGTKKQIPRWKTKVKGKLYECRYCGYVKQDNK